jgi:hypothetical protein
MKLLFDLLHLWPFLLIFLGVYLFEFNGDLVEFLKAMVLSHIIMPAVIALTGLSLLGIAVFIYTH